MDRQSETRSPVPRFHRAFRDGYGTNPYQRIYISEFARLVNRRPVTVNSWVYNQKIPNEYMPYRDKSGKRYWKPEQVEGLKVWLRSNNFFSGASFKHYNPTEKELDAALQKMRRKRKYTGRIEKEDG